MMGEKINMPIIEGNKVIFENFMEILLYYFKYRDCDAKTLELMLLAFEAGKIFGQASNSLTLVPDPVKKL